MSDYYSLLRISRYATDEEIRGAFRRRAKETHPDVRSAMSDDANDFLEVKHAYDVLSDPERRRAYDESLPSTALVVAESPSEDERPSWQAEQYEYRYSPPPPKPSRAKKVPPVPRKEIRAYERKSTPEGVYQYTCYVTLEEAYEGAKITFSIKTEWECKKCEGRGIQLMPGAACNECKGSGHASNRSFLGRMIFGDPCPACDGKGHALTPRECKECYGSGKCSAYKEDWINMPPGTQNGAVLHGPKNTLLTKISIEPHRIFERAGDDLILTKYLKESSLKRGASITIQNIKGMKVKWAIPADSEQGFEFRMPRWGMPRVGGAEIGDLIVSVRPLAARPPEPEDAEE
jgi:molecular chaperone DnaJ